MPMIMVKCVQLSAAVKALRLNYVRSFSFSRNFNFSSLVLKSRTKSSIENKVFYYKTQFPLDTINNLQRDILLFSFERSSYKYLGVFGVAQLALWIFYGGYVYASLRDISESGEQASEIFKNPLLKRLNLGDKKHKIIMVSLCVGIGSLTAFVCCLLPARTVRELWLCKGGTTASLGTYGSFGKAQYKNIPLKNISCFNARSQSKTYVALRMKPKWFYFLIDCRGEFHNTKLFDYTVGTKSTKAY